MRAHFWTATQKPYRSHSGSSTCRVERQDRVRFFMVFRADMSFVEKLSCLIRERVLGKETAFLSSDVLSSPEVYHV